MGIPLFYAEHMFTIGEIRQIINGRRFSWAVKANLVYRYCQSQNWQDLPYPDKVAYEFNKSVDWIVDSIRLARFIEKFPAFAELPTREEALEFYKKYKKDIPKLREQLNLYVTKKKMLQHRIRKLAERNDRRTNDNSET